MRKLFYDTNLNIYNLTSEDGDDTFIKAYEENRFIHYLADIALPCGLFEICYTDEYEIYTFIKVDIYSLGLGDEKKRRSMVFFKSTNQDNFDFFDNCFTYVRGKSKNSTVKMHRYVFLASFPSRTSSWR